MPPPIGVTAGNSVLIPRRGEEWPVSDRISDEFQRAGYLLGHKQRVRGIGFTNPLIDAAPRGPCREHT